MALTLKKSIPRASIATANPAPDEILPDLPEVVVKRFPELSAWQLASRERLEQFIEAMDRRTSQLEDRIETLERT